jgi:hypothetical protein
VDAEECYSSVKEQKTARVRTDDGDDARTITHRVFHVQEEHVARRRRMRRRRRRRQG